MISNTATHCVYFCQFDQIAHHLVLETYAGRARLFQSYILTEMTTECGMLEKIGYTALEWANGRPNPDWSREMLDAYRKWGGGREMSHDKFCELLELLFLLQVICDEFPESNEESIFDPS